MIDFCKGVQMLAEVQRVKWKERKLEAFGSRRLFLLFCRERKEEITELRNPDLQEWKRSVWIRLLICLGWGSGKGYRRW